MDSYEYYLLYHVNIDKFMADLSPENKEIFIALSILSKNKKLKNDKELRVIFNQLLSFIENDSNYNLDKLLQELITFELFNELKQQFTGVELTLQKLRILNILVNSSLKYNLIDNDMIKLCNLLVKFVFEEPKYRHISVGILLQIIKNDVQLKNLILNEIFKNSLKLYNKLGTMEYLCYFYKELCQENFEHDPTPLMEMCFENKSILIKKQGIFLVKCLIEHNLLDLESSENWKKFIIIFETLGENQSHLVLPSLDLMYEMKISTTFKKFWFILCSMIINHDNNLVKNFGLNFIFNMKNQKFEKDQILIILKAINSTHLYELNENNLIDKIQNFVKLNSELIFSFLIEVLNWFSTPFYYVLSFLKNENNFCTSIENFLKCFEKQTELIPKRIRNTKIRSLIKAAYADLLEKFMEKFDFIMLLPTFLNIFRIDKNHDCLDKCLKLINPDSYQEIFSHVHDYDFLKYLLVKTNKGRTIEDINVNTNHIQQNKKLVIEVMSCLNKSMDGYDDSIKMLIDESVDHIWTLITNNKLKNLYDSIEVLEVAMNASREEIKPQTLEMLMELWSKIKELFKTNPKMECFYLKLTSIILKYNLKFDAKCIEKEIFSSSFCRENLAIVTFCQVSSFRNQIVEKKNHFKYFKITMENLESLLDQSSSRADVKFIFESLRLFTYSLTQIAFQDEEFSKTLKKIFKTFISISSNIMILTFEFWSGIIHLPWDLMKNDKLLNDSINDLFVEIFVDVENSLNENNRFTLLLAIFNYFKEHLDILPNCKLVEYFRRSLFEAMYTVNPMSRDELIENALLCSLNDDDTLQKMNFRLQIANLLSSSNNEQFSKLVGNKITDLSKTSKKKVRYYPNSKLHRIKLHHYQPLIFCKTIDHNVIDELIYELMQINNQLNITYILEIILASHILNAPKLLERNEKELNAQALKSIFSIAIMQIKAEKSFKKAEKMLDFLFKKIFPFSMGQNFGVRIYSLLSIVLSLEHIKTLEDFIVTPVVCKISEICDIIFESVKQKNCLKYFNALKNDFRFTKKLEELTTARIFYQAIPTVTGMSFDEIVIDKKFESTNIIAAEMIKGMDCIVTNDELEIFSDEQLRNEVVNLQKKYLPIKNQIPGDNLLKNLPERFKPFDTDEGVLIPRSELIIVASLIDNNTNLGGLARTCEIFGISKYVIHSLKSQENFEFKTLSRTSEKWIQISEVKDWQLFDYLIAMKRYGYIIVGGEQSENSISLLDAKFPSKCIFVLGNEKKGIPANLLSLLDLVVEIPQTGVVRSLNVHVAGAILMWEYAKQHTFKKN